MLKGVKSSRANLILPAILLAGLIIRLVYLYYFRDTVFFNPVLMDKHDQKTFFIWAQQILNNPWHVDGKAFYMAPFYPYFLALLLFISGGALVPVLIFQLLLDTVICIFVFYLGKKIYDAGTGLIAAFFASFYRTSIVYAASVLSDSLIFFLYMFFMLLVYYALEKPNFIRWAAAGVVLGFAALAKPTISIYLPFLLLGLYLYPDKKMLSSELPLRLHPLMVLVILIAVSGLTILPVTLRNFSVSGEIIPICTNGLVNWKIGNSSDSIGLFYYPKGELLSPLSLPFWRLFLAKLNMFFTSYEWPQNMTVYVMEELVPSLKAAFVKFGFIAPAGMGGLILMLRNWRKNFIFISFALSNVLWVVLFFIVDRYRLPAAGCFMVSSAYLLAWSVGKIKKRNIISALAIWVFVGIFAYFYNITPGPLVPPASIETFAALSVKNIQNDLSLQDTESAYKKAVQYYRLMPGDFRSTFMLACVFADMGQKENGVRYLEETLRINPGFEPAQRFLEDLKTGMR